MQRQFGQMVVPMDLATAFSIMDGINESDPEVKRTAEEIAGSAIAAPEYCAKSFINLARYEVSLLRIAKELDVCALAACCWSQLQERYGIAACSTYARLNQRGLITACEVDVLGAASMWVSYCAGLGEAIPDFIDWTDLHPTQENVWLAWHCGNAAPSLCAPGCGQKLMSNERLLLWSDTCHGTLEFNLKPGPVTCSRLVEYGGKYTLFAGVGEIVDIEPFVRGAYGWVKVNDVFDWEDKMVEHGIIHHGNLIHGADVADALAHFCKFLDIMYVRGN